MANNSSGVSGDNGSRVGPPPQYVDIDKLESADGIVGIISRRRSTGVLTFGIFKEFTRDGHVERSSFVPETMAVSYLQMVQLVIERIAQINAEAVKKAAGK